MTVPTMVRSDITDRADVYALLSRFYGQALIDDVLAEPFSEVRAKGLDEHLPVMCDFWETMLLRARLYQRSALEVHREVHLKHPLTHEHFLRWLTLWVETVDAMFSGPVAEKAKLHGRRTAWAFHRRLTGHDVPELDAAALPTPRAGVSPGDRPQNLRGLRTLAQ
ncbi:group III truncated hemoglobin [[Mycobacterium] burgundiense]|uniref:Group III truncated hemoglobin n=1 Tax=[Mycobacterium] burgundiense TaxID=3064286 RepID=A0ABM9LFS8_9MYCO|nr:group III truncated hemoglobin [Mycolicibacterium sp. MU0053]CAJ1498280.1 group III truncated hemoglobin [Mycolicibacterium sp. MU0053]